MQQRPLGASGIQTSVVGFGAWAIGGWMWGGAEEGDAIRAIQAAIDAGINLIDTAPAYGFGTSESLVGKAIQGRRQRVVLATKCGLIWHAKQGEYFFSSSEETITPTGNRDIHRCLTPAMIRYEIEQSLMRLGVDCIDLYLTHWQDNTTPVGETMGELLKLKEEGKIRAIGCSNATPKQMEAYRSVGPLDVDQEKYSMLDRAQDDGNLPYCAQHRMAFLAYSPLAQGLLTGKIGSGRNFAAGDQRAGAPRFSPTNRLKIAAMLAEFQPIAAAHQLSLGQLAIAWTVAQPGCTHALVGARTAAQAVENAKAGTARLTHDEVASMCQSIARHAAGIP
jgi:aryl-alcohol dehydrogenase-like predicted oxidoreductase